MTDKMAGNKMNKQTYIAELEQLLSHLPEEDKGDAIEYFKEYFDEAGVENESSVIENLGPPAKVAAKIKADAAMKNIQNEPAPKMKKGISTIWVVLLGILALPIALPLGIAAVAIIVSVLIAIGAVVISLVVADIAIVGTGIISFISGVVVLFESGATGMFYIGAGLAAMGGGILFGILIFLVARVTFRWIAGLINKRRLKEEKKYGVKQNTQQSYDAGADRGTGIDTSTNPGDGTNANSKEVNANG